MLKLTLSSDGKPVFIDPTTVFVVFPNKAEGDDACTVLWVGPGRTETLRVKEDAEWLVEKVRRAKEWNG